MQFTDRMTMDGALRRTADGYGVVSARVARGGNVQTYLGSELGITDKALVRVYRPESEVFKKDAIASYAGVPITIGHPSGKVTAETWKDLAVGEAGDEVLRDGEFVRVPLMLRDAKGIQTVEAGTVELSMGYDANVTVGDGISPSGEPYDATMSDFKMNHVAIVEKARGGEQLRIGDSAGTWGIRPVNLADERTVPMTDTLRTVVVGDEAVSTTAEGERAITKLKALVASKDEAIADAETTHKAAIAAKDEEIGTLKADLKKAQDAALKPADLDKLVADRAALIGTVKAIDAKIDPAGKTDADLRKAAVAAKLGDEMVKDASEAEIAGMFKAVAKDVKAADPFRDAVKDGLTPTNDDLKPVNDARAKMLADLQSGAVSAPAN